jgi:hypothetical protein
MLEYDYSIETEIKHGSVIGYISDDATEGSEIRSVNTGVDYELIGAQVEIGLTNVCCADEKNFRPLECLIPS